MEAHKLNATDVFKDSINLKNPREEGRKAVRSVVPDDIWAMNSHFVDRLQSIIAKHPIATHPVKEYFEHEQLNDEKTKNIHLEFGHAFAQTFTDAVLITMSNSKQLENRYGPRAKVAARFLWSLNLMDELGFFPSDNGTNYKGHPFFAHYYQYVDLFNSLNMEERSIVDYANRASKECQIARSSFEDTYSDYQLSTTILAVGESIFDTFASSWAKNVAQSSNIDVTKGYHTIHVHNDSGFSIDEDHSEDGWYLVKQALDPKRHAEIEEKVRSWLDAWYRFADRVLDIASK